MARERVKRLGDWVAFDAALKKLPRSLLRASQLSGEQVAQELSLLIKDAYARRGKGAELTSRIRKPQFRTLATRSAGKTTGRGLRAPSKSNKPLFVTGKLADSVRVISRRLRFEVGINTAARSPDGRLSMIDVAKRNEHGRIYTMKLTKRARRYLRWAFRKAGLEKPSGRKRTGKESAPEDVIERAEGVIAIRIPPRPIWTLARRALEENFMRPNGRFPQLNFHKKMQIHLPKDLRLVPARVAF